ncbi:MAG: hypothetical protein U0795_01415 [Pirellulales bacterium]
MTAKSTIALLAAAISIAGCLAWHFTAHPSVDDLSVAQMSSYDDDPLNAFWYIGSDDRYHYFYRTEWMDRRHYFRVLKSELNIAATMTLDFGAGGIHFVYSETPPQRAGSTK